MIDALKGKRRSYLAQLLVQSDGWPDRGRAFRSRLVGTIVRDWARLKNPPAHGGSGVRALRQGPHVMKANELYPSRYLKTDAVEEDMHLTIREVAMSDDTSFEEQRPLAYFKEIEPPFVLNKTNVKTLRAAFGNETDDWVGQRVTLYPTEVDYQGKMVATVRIRVPKAKAAPVTNGKPTDDTKAKAKTAERARLERTVTSGKQPSTKTIIDDDVLY